MSSPINWKTCKNCGKQFYGYPGSPSGKPKIADNSWEYCETCTYELFDENLNRIKKRYYSKQIPNRRNG